MRKLLDRLHSKLGDLWWYSLMIFVACRSGDVIQAFIGLWLVPKYVGQEELGAVLPLQQLSGLFAVPLAILATVFAKYVNTYATRGEYGKVKSFIRDVLLTACGVFLVCIIAAYLIIPHFYIRLNVTSGMLTVLVLAAGFASNIASIFTAALQGLKKFKTMTVQNLISAPIRLVTMLVAMPFRALSGYILGQATPPASCSVLAAISLHKDLKSVPLDTSWRKDLPEIWKYLWPVAVYMGAQTLFGAVITTIYRQRLPEVESAAYYLLSRFAETSAYIGMTLSTVLIPLASEAHEKGDDPTGILRQSLFGILLGAIAFTTIFFFAAPHILGGVKDWSHYADYAYLLPYLAVNCSLSAAITVCCSYEMSCRRFGALMGLTVLNALWVGFLVCFTGYGYFHGVLPDRFVEWMASLKIASIRTITLIGIPFGLIQLAFILIVIRHNSSKTRARKH